MNLVGLDIGEKTGFCGLVLDDKYNVVGSEVKEITVVELDEFFVFNLARAVEEAIVAFNADFVVIEGYGYGGKGFFNVMQAELTGQVKRMMVDTGISFYEVPISSLRYAVLNNGRANKGDAKKFAQEFFKKHNLILPKSNEYHFTDAVIPAVLAVMFVQGTYSEEFERRIAESVIGGCHERSIFSLLERYRERDTESVS